MDCIIKTRVKGKLTNTDIGLIEITSGEFEIPAELDLTKIRYNGHLGEMLITKTDSGIEISPHFVLNDFVQNAVKEYLSKIEGLNNFDIITNGFEIIFNRLNFKKDGK